MKLHILVIIFCAILSACGQPIKETDSRSRKSVTYNSYSSNPIELVKESSECLTAFSHYDLEVKLHNASIFKNFESVLDGRFVRDPKKASIESSSYNHSIEYTVFNSLNGRVNYSSRELRSPLSITVCPNENYSSASVENAALITSYYINKTSLEVLRAKPDLKIPPIKLSIGPLIKVNNQKEREHDITQESRYWVDNASYTPHSKTIAFYPQSKEAKRSGLNTKLWQVPMVSSHEYAHHIFNHIFPYDSANKEISICIDNRSLYDENFTLNSSFNVKDVINSYNEGFADLVANYVLDEKEVSLKGLDCMEDNREITSASFQDGSLKIFNESTHYRIFSPWYVGEIGNCRSPDFKDIHIVGAVFAYSADNYLSQYHFTKFEKLKLLLEWVHLIKKNHSLLQNYSAEEYMKATITELVLLPSKFNRKIEQTHCESVSYLFSALQLEIPACSGN